MIIMCAAVCALQLKQQGRPKDYYRILGTSQSTSENELRLSYRLLALRHHPDRGGRTALCDLVNEAYVVLGNRQRRQQCKFLLLVLSLGPG
jgi:preprotein translocase subunit Sec63